MARLWVVVVNQDKKNVPEAAEQNVSIVVCLSRDTKRSDLFYIRCRVNLVENFRLCVS